LDVDEKTIGYSKDKIAVERLARGEEDRTRPTRVLHPIHKQLAVPAPLVRKTEDPHSIRGAEGKEGRSITRGQRP